MKTIVFANHKGGCAKTTTCMNLAVVLASEGARVLVVDLDPQGNLSVALGADLEELEETQRTSLRMMLDRKGEYKEFVIPVRNRLDLIPACLDHDAETLLEGQPVSRDVLLKKKLESADDAYDYCVIDTPPALRSPTLNALAMSDLTIIPIETSLFALVGLTQLLRMIALASQDHSPNMIIMGLSTMYVGRQNADKTIRGNIIKKLKGNVFETTIPRSVAISQAVITYKSVYETDPTSTAAFAFFELAQEIRSLLADGQEESIRRDATEHQQGA